MNCKEYQKYLTGKLTKREFLSHSQGCNECQESWAFEQMLNTEIDNFKTVIPSATLWSDVRVRLLKEKQAQVQSIFTSKIYNVLTNFTRRPQWRLGFAAVLTVAIIIGLVNIQGGSKERFLSQSAIAQVDKKEREYAQAIAELENIVALELTSIENDLTLLYRDKLETIDAQIAQCKEALEIHPYSAHIRRYLLAAYREKKETLQEVLQYTKNFNLEKNPIS